MNRSASISKHGFVFLTCALVLGVTAQAQENARLRPDVRSISLKLSTESTKVCLGSFVPLELKMTNRSDHEVKVSKLDVWRYFSFDYVDVDGSMKSVGYLISPGRLDDYVRLRDEIFSLQPQAAYTSRYNFPLGDSRFLKNPGKYTLKSYFGEAGSNVVSFETYDCNSK